MNQGKERMSYRDAGVDINAATQALKKMKTFINQTFDDHVLQDIGLFGAMYQPDLRGFTQPVLVSSVDGVGTKLKLAFMTGRHNTVGIDLVSHCVNDILVQGARPLFFLDYLACGRLNPDIVTEVIHGITMGCRYAGCALIGGETAEMPDMYAQGEYDLAGTIVGIVDRHKIIDGSRIQDGDILIGFPSSGLHTNGYSLARKICFEKVRLSCDDEMPGVGRTVGDELLEPHRSYAKLIQLFSRLVDIKGMAHITGGGITDNLPRILPAGLGAEVHLDSWEVPPVFSFLQQAGNVEESEMLRTFNMGIGFITVIAAAEQERAISALEQIGEPYYIIGSVIEKADEPKVVYTGRFSYDSSN